LIITAHGLTNALASTTSNIFSFSSSFFGSISAVFFISLILVPIRCVYVSLDQGKTDWKVRPTHWEYEWMALIFYARPVAMYFSFIVSIPLWLMMTCLLTSGM
jgi:hypothetical protein